ncbi:hypothetical protein [Streptomyces sp. NPDC004629]|uniref:hypothetical protein n=1 Tax=Streptomyces sp. NPDC004629 TaxID=3364705 RepID=UPI0036BDB818
MKATRRLMPLLLAPALFALSACGIPATGVVEAGGPASGIVPVTPVYFVRDGALVAVRRTTASPGDVQAAVELLFAGPTPAEVLGSLSTEVPGAPTAAPPAPGGSFAVPGRAPADAPTVSVKGDTVTVRLSGGIDRLSRLATRQLVCTAAAAHRIGTPSADAVTVTVTVGGWRAKATDGDCPGG